MKVLLDECVDRCCARDIEGHAVTVFKRRIFGKDPAAKRASQLPGFEPGGREFESLRASDKIMYLQSIGTGGWPRVGST